jgi:transcriptional regulator with XRE-family HTH domain
MRTSSPEPTGLSFRERCARFLRVERERQGISQEVLAVRAGFHRTYVSHMERAVQNMSLESVESVMQALGLQSDESSIALSRFAKNLKETRLARGLSQEKLGELAGVHRTYVSQAERAVVSISIDSIERLALALDSRPEELVGFETQ